VKGKFPLKGIAKQLMDMETGELVLLNDKKSIAQSEMLSLRKIEGVLMQSRYVCTMWQTIILLVLTNNHSGERRDTSCTQCSSDKQKHRVFAVSFYLVYLDIQPPTNCTLGVSLNSWY
jgi:hypothetical protein